MYRPSYSQQVSPHTDEDAQLPRAYDLLQHTLERANRAANEEAKPKTKARIIVLKVRKSKVGKFISKAVHLRAKPAKALKSEPAKPVMMPFRTSLEAELDFKVAGQRCENRHLRARFEEIEEHPEYLRIARERVDELEAIIRAKDRQGKLLQDRNRALSMKLRQRMADAGEEVSMDVDVGPEFLDGRFN